MCYNCGCQNPEDDMGDPDNITTQTINHLAGHWGKSIDETKSTLLKMLENQDKALEQDEHLKEMFNHAANAWGQSIDQAKNNTLALLKKQHISK